MGIDYTRPNADCKRFGHVVFVLMALDEWEKLFGSRVKAIRKTRGWTQEELARRMSDAGHPMHQTTLAKIESGTRPTSVAELGALSTLLEVSIGSLFGSADQLEKQMELRGLDYQIRSLSAEHRRTEEQLVLLQHRIVEIRHEQHELQVEYDKIKSSTEAIDGRKAKGGK
mgnify:CR=1 FL=1